MYIDFESRLVVMMFSLFALVAQMGELHPLSYQWFSVPRQLFRIPHSRHPLYVCPVLRAAVHTLEGVSVEDTSHLSSGNANGDLVPDLLVLLDCEKSL